MDQPHRRILNLGLTALLLMCLLISGFTTPIKAHPGMLAEPLGFSGPEVGFGTFQDDQADTKAPPGPRIETVTRDPQMIVEVIQASKGFALADNESHVLRVQILRQRQLQPSDIRRLLRENKSIGEIRAEIEKVDVVDDGAFLYRGYMKLGENLYELVDINLTDDAALLEAEVIEPHWGMWPDGDAKVVGHIRTETTYREGTRISEGELSIYHGKYGGDYLVLAEDSHHMGGCHMECPRA